MSRKRNFREVVLFALAVMAGGLPFAAPAVCLAALKEGLALCGGPLLLSLFPFLIVSTLLVRCPAGVWLALPLRPLVRFIGLRANGASAARVLLIGLVGGFAPAAAAAGEAVCSGQLSGEEADALLPACVCSSPSFVILAVGQTLLGSAGLGVLLYLSQLGAGFLAAALLCRLGTPPKPATNPLQQTAGETVRLDAVIASAALAYVKLCAFVLFFRMLAAGAGALLPPKVGTACAMLLEVCSGCDLASRTGRWASLLCCACLSMQGLSVLLQVRSLCPPEMALRPLYLARAVHLPLSLAMFYALLPRVEQSVFSTLAGRVVLMRRLPPDCALLVFLVCCLSACELTRAAAAAKSELQLPEKSGTIRRH